MSEISDYMAAGGSPATLVSSMIDDAGATDIFNRAPSVSECAEPIVVRLGDYERESRQHEEDRGVWDVNVYVVRENQFTAQAVAIALEWAIRSAQWDEHCMGYHVRIVGIDTDAPKSLGRDSSGRWVWQFKVLVTVVRKP